VQPFRVKHRRITLRAPASASLRVRSHAHSLSSKVRLSGGSALKSVDKDSLFSVTAPVYRYDDQTMLPPPQISEHSQLSMHSTVAPGQKDCH
jgi:hypothetical protein